MAMIGNSGYASKVITLDAANAQGFADMGFTSAEIADADAAHVSHITVTDNAPTLYYWYNLESGTPKVPLSETTGGGSPEGHPVFPGGERMIRGVRNIRNFRIISGANTARIAVTLGTFGRGT